MKLLREHVMLLREHVKLLRAHVKLLLNHVKDITCARKKFHFFHHVPLGAPYVNMGPNNGENLKTLLLLQIATKSFQTCPEFSPVWSWQNYIGNFWNLEFYRFFRQFQIHRCTPMEKPKPLQIGVKVDTQGDTSKIYMVYLGPCNAQSHFGVIRWICNFS